MMTIHLSLLAMVVASALHLVQIRFEARYLHVELQRAQARWRVLQHEHLELSAKAHSLAQSSNISEQARTRLEMVVPTPWTTISITRSKPAQDATPVSAVQTVQGSVQAP